MNRNLVSLLIGVSCGLVFFLALRGKRGPRRTRLGLMIGVPALVLISIWASWWGEFPQTFGPFFVSTLLSSAEGRTKADRETQR